MNILNPVRKFTKTSRDFLNNCFSGFGPTMRDRTGAGVANRERRVILFLVLALSLFGLLMIYEASSIYAWRLTQDYAYFFKRQLLYFIVSLCLFFGILAIDLDIFRKQSGKLLLFNIFLLVVVLVMGVKRGGARRWISFLGFNFQPSELLKISFLIYCADYFTRKGALLRSFREGICPLIFVFGLVSLLLLLEPDLGTIIFWLVWLFIMLFVLNAKKRLLFFVLVSGIILSAILVKLYPWRFSRIISYLNPWKDPQGSGYQLIQSQIAYGRGGFLGVGLGESRQKLLFLPAAHTDFIFSIIAEEFGFVGSIAVLLTFFIILFKLLKLTLSCPDIFRRNLSLGVTLIFVLQVAINIGVTCGLLPTKGLPLPFISYGGSNLVVHFILLGLLFNASRTTTYRP
jgi:cell division protein FtsW